VRFDSIRDRLAELGARSAAARKAHPMMSPAS
jgi:hypothetical protein